MKVAMFQPPFFGPAYLAARANEVDLFILSGTDQFTKHSPNLEGKPQKTGQAHTLINDGWITLQTSDSMKPIDETRTLIDQHWIDKTMRRLDYNYKTEHWKKSRHEVEELLVLGSYYDLGDFNALTFEWALKKLGCNTQVTRDKLVTERQDDKSDTALALAIATGATEYITGAPGYAYLDHEKWNDAGIKVTIQNWEPPVGVNPTISTLHLVASGFFF
jgi:hypothetical protein